MVPRKTAHVSAQVLCRTPYNHAPVYSVTLFKATHVGYNYARLTVTTLFIWCLQQIFTLLALTTNRTAFPSGGAPCRQPNFLPSVRIKSASFLPLNARLGELENNVLSL